MQLRDVLVDAVCSQRDRIPLLIGMVAVVGLLLVFPLALLEPGTQGHVIAVIDAILVVGLLLVLVPTYWYCTRRAME